MNAESIALHQKGAALQKAGDLAGARDAYLAALALDPRLEVTRSNVAALCYQSGEVEHAINHYLTLLDTHPLNIKARYSLGTVYAAVGRYEQASQAFRAVLQLAPDHALALTQLARIFIQQSRHGEAIATLEQLIIINPNDPSIHHQLGLLKLTIGDAASAEKIWLTGLNLQHHHQPILLALAQLKAHQARWHDCQHYTQLVLNRTPDHTQALLMCAQAHTRLLEYTQACDVLHQLLKFYPQNTDALFQLATIQHTRGDLQAAKALLIDALGINDQHSGCHNELGTLFYREGNWAMALQHYREAATLNPENPIIKANIGFTHLALGERDAAAQLFEEYLNKPDQSETVTHSVQCALALL